MNIQKLSVVIICKNEEKNIARALKSASFADEIIVVDSGSIDNTVSIARTFPNAKIFITEWKGYVENKKFGIKHASHDWILWLDADECLTSSLVEEWKHFATQDFSILTTVAAISVPRKTFFLGHWVKHSGWFPDRITRFFHKTKAHFNSNILHEGLIIDSKYETVHFSSFLLHYSYSSLIQYFYKMNMYGLVGAKELQRRGKKVYIYQIFLNPLWAFIKFYVLKKGFLDGLIGIIVCTGAAFSNFIKYANYFFLKKYGYVENTSEQN